MTLDPWQEEEVHRWVHTTSNEVPRQTTLRTATKNICMYTHVHYVHALMAVLLDTFAYMHLYIHAYMHTHTMHERMHSCTHTNTQTHMHRARHPIHAECIYRCHLCTRLCPVDTCIDPCACVLEYM